MTNGENDNAIRDVFVIFEITDKGMEIPLCFSILEKAAEDIVRYDYKHQAPGRKFSYRFMAEIPSCIPHHCYFNIQSHIAGSDPF